MTDGEAESLGRRVAAYLERRRVLGAAENPWNFARFVDEIVAEAQQDLPGIDRLDLLVTTAMFVFGPRLGYLRERVLPPSPRRRRPHSTGPAPESRGSPSHWIPPKAMRSAVLDIVRQELTGMVGENAWRQRTVEIVPAYGCGKWRVGLDEVVSGWSGRWEPAIRWLEWHVGCWVWNSHLWLRYVLHLESYPPDGRVGTPEDLGTAVQEIATKLVYGNCACWREIANSPNAPPNRNASQRSDRCKREHRLSAWNPSEVSLGAFIAQAVKGGWWLPTARSRPRDRSAMRPHPITIDDAEARGRAWLKLLAKLEVLFVPPRFVQGMLFPYLYTTMDIRWGPALGRRCPSHPERWVFGEKCTAQDCDTPFADDNTRWMTVRRLIVRAPSGHYSSEKRWHCKLGHYYPVEQQGCVIHEQPNPQRLSTVWVRRVFPAQNIIVNADAPQHAEVKEFLEYVSQALGPDYYLLAKILIDGGTQEEAADRLNCSLEEVHDMLEELKRLFEGWQGSST